MLIGVFLGFITLLVLYELSGSTLTYYGKVIGKQKRVLDGKLDLFYIEIWYECPNGANVYNLFVDESDFNRLWEGDTVSFTARLGRLSPWLYNRKLLT